MKFLEQIGQPLLEKTESLYEQGLLFPILAILILLVCYVLWKMN